MAERRTRDKGDIAFKLVCLDTLTLNSTFNTKEAALFGTVVLEQAPKLVEWELTKDGSLADMLVASKFKLPPLESLNSTKDEELDEPLQLTAKDASTTIAPDWLSAAFTAPQRVLEWEVQSRDSRRCTGLAHGSVLAKEESYQSAYSNVLYPLEHSVTERTFIQILVKTLQCIPNQFFQFKDNQVTQKQGLRLLSCSPHLTQALVSEVTDAAAALLRVRAVLDERDLNLCLKEAVEHFLDFYQRYLFEQKEETLLTFRLKSLFLRSQLVFVERIVTEISGSQGNDSELVDMLLELLEVAEIDYESNCIVRSFFVKLSKGFLEQLSQCIYAADLNNDKPFLFSLTSLPEDLPSYQRSIELVNAPGVLSKLAESLLRCIRTVLLFKSLDKRLPPYWSVLAKNSPVLKLEFTKSGFIRQEAALLDFAASQRTQLFNIEKQIMLAEELKRKEQLEARLAFLHSLKKTRELVGAAKDRLRSEEQDKKRFFYELLSGQIQDNKARNEKARQKAALEEEKKRREEESELLLIEKGKRYLMEQYAALVHNSRLILVEWRARRAALAPKRLVAIMKQLNPASMDLEVQEPAVMAEKTTVEPIFERIRQPPGGNSEMLLVMQHQAREAPVKAVQVVRPIKFDSYSLVSEVFCDEVLRRVYLLIKAKKEPRKLADYKTNFVDIVGEAVHIVEYPASLVWNRLVVDPIVSQIQAVDQAGLHLFVRSLKLEEHLTALRSFALMGAGDTFDLFLLYLPSHQLPQSAWEMAVNLSSSKDNPYAERFKIQYGSEEDFKVNYETEWPLNLVIHAKSLEHYSKVFNWLLRMRRTSQLLSNCKAFFHNLSLRRLKGTPDAQMRRVQLLRHRMHLFVTLLQEHVATVVHGSAWLELERSLSKAGNIEALVEVHDSYLNSVISKCSLEGRSRFVIEHAKIMFSLVERLHGLLLDACPFQPFTATELEALQTLETDFNRVHRFLFTMTKSIAAKGQSSELFLRIDYNGFLANQLA
jgi:hypothetical protein